MQPHRQAGVQSLQHHDKPGRDHRLVSSHESLRWQSAANARRVPRLSGARRPERRRGARTVDDALGNAAPSETTGVSVLAEFTSAKARGIQNASNALIQRVQEQLKS
jgi:hypothetical protein